ncbi:hypothetical protein [Streptomyces sp. NWU339]|uniref:hypothetical protein n=1 Tax=Streptomyces sp. NWU339 TaxID=2185284 RepID=UPI0011B3E9A9|nr:hypothetical protein [Streptomyces sp. NWU339]
MNTAPTEDHSPSCRDLVGLLAQPDRRARQRVLPSPWFRGSARTSRADQGIGQDHMALVRQVDPQYRRDRLLPPDSSMTH